MQAVVGNLHRMGITNTVVTNVDGKDIIKDAYTLEPLTEYSEEVVKQDVPEVDPSAFDFDF